MWCMELEMICCAKYIYVNEERWFVDDRWFASQDCCCYFEKIQRLKSLRVCECAWVCRPTEEFSSLEYELLRNSSVRIWWLLAVFLQEKDTWQCCYLSAFNSVAARPCVQWDVINWTDRAARDTEKFKDFEWKTLVTLVLGGRKSTLTFPITYQRYRWKFDQR